MFLDEPKHSFPNKKKKKKKSKAKKTKVCIPKEKHPLFNKKDLKK